MYKFFKSSIGFICFLSVFYIVFIILWGSFFSNTPVLKNLNYKIGSPGYMFTRMKELKTTKNVDILFLGSSHTYRSFDTRIFKSAGFKTFNLGSSAQTPIQTEFLVNNYIKSINPKIVIFEVNPVSLSSDGIESSLDIIANGENSFEYIKFALKHKHLKIFNTLIYSLYREIFFDEKSTFIEERENSTDKYFSGGFVQREMSFYNSRTLEKQKLQLNKEQIKSLKKIVTILNQSQIKLILVQAPVTSTVYNSYDIKLNFDDEIRKNGQYYNFNELLELKDSIHFYDADHLNQNGVEIFNKMMLNILVENNKFHINN